MYMRADIGVADMACDTFLSTSEADMPVFYRHRGMDMPMFHWHRGMDMPVLY